MTSSCDLLRDIAFETEQTRGLTGINRLSERVMSAIHAVPREQFVPALERARAFDNTPLPIGHGQTISQPFIVALMTELLEPDAADRILEIGTGSGYQAAVLSRLAKEVCTIEIVTSLAEAAADRLRSLGYDNVVVRAGDGGLGWPDRAPFDGIMITAATPEVPDELFDQLKPGGRLVAPIGLPHEHQELTVFRKHESGRVTGQPVLGVVFVPMTGAYGALPPCER